MGLGDSGIQDYGIGGFRDSGIWGLGNLRIEGLQGVVGYMAGQAWIDGLD